LRGKATLYTDSPPRILLVEDFEDLRKQVSLYLSSRGYQVLEAPNGGVAIQTALSGKLNFILIDFRLPDMNGVELARELRKLPQTEQVPIVGWSADSRNPRRETLRQAGITEYLEKPIRLKDLDAVIERFVPKSKESH
jgi:CheY-like chemotaxis protein